MKKCFIHYSLTKTTLAALAVILLLASAPAYALTSWVHGGMWASTGGEPNDIVYPDGITASTTPAQATNVADSVAADYREIDINFVRIDVDPATITNNWPVVQAYVNELVADGLFVDICGSYNTTNNVLVDLTPWKVMWQQIDGVYKNNNSVYYEPLNEPYGYNLSGLTNVYSTFLNSYGIAKGHSFIILQSGGSGATVPAIGAVFTDCTLAFHDYWGSGITTESGWSNDVVSHAGVCANRCIVTEYGAPTVTNTMNYQVSSSDSFITYLRGLTAAFRALPMGSIWFPAHQNNANLKRMFTGIGGDIFNRSALNRMQYGWNFFTPTEAPPCDFNTNGMTAYSVFRPSNQHWYIYPGIGGIQYGASTDVAVPADYNGDGFADIAVWRPSNGGWYVYPSVNPTLYGTSGDIPVPGDYAGTGNAQFALWRPSNGNWYINGVAIVQWGTNGDIPVPGYYNGDGHLDYAVYRPSNNKWYVYGQTAVQFGTNGDIPVPGDYNGSGTTQIAMWRPSNGNWYIYGVGTTNFGINGDVPVPGDYANSGFTQMATWSPSNFVWNVYGVGQTTYGTTNDVPLSLPYAIRHYSLGYSN
jgi:hypothetical protein